MHVKVLHTVEYDDTGWNWSSRDILYPNWDQIEGAVRQLDKFHFPYVWFSCLEAVNGRFPEDHWPEFEIMGGSGDYWMAYSCEEFQQGRYFGPEQGDAVIDVWTSDQGFSAENRFICHDLNRVIAAAAYFYDHGQPAPFIPWEASR